ncbi:hypothetical protein XENTR_v10020611 [Xenopus tropicalis]|nr:hypothetical protein XENTR_v10020611 [Xenopus tropicalis]
MCFWLVSPQHFKNLAGLSNCKKEKSWACLFFSSPTSKIYRQGRCEFFLPPYPRICFQVAQLTSKIYRQGRYDFFSSLPKIYRQGRQEFVPPSLTLMAFTKAAGILAPPRSLLTNKVYLADLAVTELHIIICSNLATDILLQEKH